MNTTTPPALEGQVDRAVRPKDAIARILRAKFGCVEPLSGIAGEDAVAAVRAAYIAGARAEKKRAAALDAAVAAERERHEQWKRELRQMAEDAADRGDVFAQRVLRAIGPNVGGEGRP